jgi:hypothetical protein
VSFTAKDLRKESMPKSATKYNEDLEGASEY